MRVCGNCGTPNQDRARFCQECGQPLGAVPAVRREARKTVTIVFCDVTGSTALGERLDPESLRRVMSRYFDTMQAVLARHGGTVEKFIGDAVMAVFGIPEVHEDDALRATRAALEMRDSLGALNEELERTAGVRLEVRTGVNTGEVVAGDPSTGQNLVTGDAVNVAARLEQAAAPGEILLGPTTHRMVRDAVFVEAVPALHLKGKEAPMAAVRLLEVVPGVLGHARRLDAPLVGRTQELRLLDWAWARSLRERTCHLFTILGPAGVGKSRLVAEAARSLDAALIVRGECPAYGEGVTFFALAQAVRSALGLSETDGRDAVAAGLNLALEGEPDAELVGERVADLLDVSAQHPAPISETAWAVRRLCEAVARRWPLLIILDDLHWAEPGLLDLIEHVADWTRDAPILMVCVARPELLDSRPSWGGGKVNATSLLLEPLTEPESDELLINLMGDGTLADEARRFISGAAEGNPLFVEEFLAMLLDDDLLRWDGSTWSPTVDLQGAAVPPSISALLSARLDRLSRADRTLLERASVVGKLAERDAILDLTPPDEREAADTSFSSLVRRDLLRPERVPAGDAFAFRHVLLRDAAYEGLPKQERAELHERHAAWLEASVGTDGQEERVAFHLEAAVLARLALGPLDDPGCRLARRGAELLAAGGQRARSREDAAAAGLLTRAVTLSDHAGATDPYLLIAQGRTLDEVGRSAEAVAALTRAGEMAAATGDAGLAANVHVEQLRIGLHAEPVGTLRVIDEDAAAAIAVFEGLGDQEGLARVWHLLSTVHWTRGRLAAAEVATRRAAEYARAVGDGLQETSSLGTLASIFVFGPTPVSEGIAFCEATLALPGRRPGLEGRVKRALGVLRAMQEDFDGGRELIERSREIFVDLGLSFYVAGADQARGILEMLAGESVAAVAAFRASYDILRGLGDTFFMATGAGYLATALHDVGELEEASALARVAREQSPEDDVDSQMGWRTAEARGLVAHGQLDEAVRLAREALAYQAESDLAMTPDVRMEAAEVLLAAGYEEEAVALAREALAGHRAKGNLAAARWAERFLARSVPLLGGSRLPS